MFKVYKGGSMIECVDLTLVGNRDEENNPSLICLELYQNDVFTIKETGLFDKPSLRELIRITKELAEKIGKREILYKAEEISYNYIEQTYEELLLVRHNTLVNALKSIKTDLNFDKTHKEVSSEDQEQILFISDSIDYILDTKQIVFKITFSIDHLSEKTTLRVCKNFKSASEALEFLERTVLPRDRYPIIRNCYKG
jgi:hypothetical protein